MQAYLEDAARAANVAFSLPETWNPPVKSAPSPGVITKIVPKLVKSAGGKFEEVFVLAKGGQRRGPIADGANAGASPPGDFQTPNFGGGDGGGRRRMDPAAMEERMQAQIDKLPVAQRPAAQARFNQDREFWKSLRDLPPDQRRAKIEEHMSDPAVQDRMDSRQAGNDARRTPEQRMQRYQRYVNNKMAARQRTQ